MNRILLWVVLAGVNAHPPPVDETGMTADEVAALGAYVANPKK